MNSIEQQFFNDLEKKLWIAADKLRSNLDAAVYKHVVADTFHAWQTTTPSSRAGDGRCEGVYQDIPGFCYSASLEDIRKHEHVLTPGRYVGAEEQEADSEVFADKMARLTAQLTEQFAESAKLEGEIKRNLAGLGYEL
jgi:type I restriction enzyme M protein